MHARKDILVYGKIIVLTLRGFGVHGVLLSLLEEKELSVHVCVSSCGRLDSDNDEIKVNKA